MAVWPLSLMGAVYLGIADRALELAVAGSLRKRSIAIERGAYAYNPMVQHQIAEMYLELDAATATLDRFAGDWVAGADIEASLTQRIYSTKWRSVEAAKRVVDVALDVVGGAGMFKGNELERLYRDVRCGGFHPGNDALTHQVVGQAVLGVLQEQPRRGFRARGARARRLRRGRVRLPRPPPPRRGRRPARPCDPAGRSAGRPLTHPQPQ